jgi:hypothetical protein
MNSDMARENSRFMAGRIIDAAGENTLAQIERAYLLALGRKPSEDERKAAATALERMTSEWRKQLEQDKPEEPIQNRAPWLALSTFCHTLINSAEFLYIE